MIRDNGAGSAVVAGWMLTTDGPFDTYQLSVNGEVRAVGHPAEREGLAQAFPHVPQASRGGFRFEINEMPPSGMLEVVGSSANRAGSTKTPYRLDLDAVFPTPPPELMYRVTNNRSPHYFKLTGLQNAYEFEQCLRRHVEPGPVVLDWGCGCGRMTMYLSYAREVVGADIDREAIDYCGQVFSGRFAVVPLMPPTEFEDKQFDAITAYSVLTHLDRNKQIAWLHEMHRVLRPGGILVASVHGDFATSFNPGFVQGVHDDGIHDKTIGTLLNGVAPKGYYRAVFQSRNYVERVFAAILEVVEYIPAGASNYQDLVVMRRPN